MQDPEYLFEVDQSVAAQVGSEPVLIHSLRGFIDAGGAGLRAAEHLTARFDPQRLVTFDIDELLDYRSRRPTMAFEQTAWTAYDEPYLAIDVLHDQGGRPFLLLHGLEPDLRWESWAAAVAQLADRFSVRLVVGLHGIPMGVPHTRPTSVTPHATRGELVAGEQTWIADVRVPASASALLEYRLGRRGIDAMGYAVHVPHYLANQAYPMASMVGLAHVERATGLDLDSPSLEAEVTTVRLAIDQQIGQTPELATLVSALEEQYDDVIRAIAPADSAPLADALGGEMPTADELGAEFERFLAEQAGDGSGGADG